MPNLILKFKDTKINDFLLDQGRNITIGRREGNDIVIENLAVSGMHAKIDAIDKGYLLTDLKSKNGTFVNGQLIATDKISSVRRFKDDVREVTANLECGIALAGFHKFEELRSCQPRIEKHSCGNCRL